MKNCAHPVEGGKPVAMLCIQNSIRGSFFGGSAMIMTAERREIRSSFEPEMRDD